MLDEIAAAPRRRRRRQPRVGRVGCTGGRDQLARLVRNLLDNARRHAQTRVELSLADRDDDRRAHVDDDGPGIDPDDRERVFERFTRLDDGRARDAGGLGIGLAIVKAIVEQHGGTVTIDDAPIGGARFVVPLPAAASSPRRRRIPSSESTAYVPGTMPQLTIVSFNTHAGLQPRRDGRCAPTTSSRCCAASTTPT